MHLIGFVIFGVVVGIYSSFLGLGGGLLIVPLMAALGYDMKTAVATSLAVIIPTVIIGVVSEWAHHRIDWRIALLLAIGSVGGVLIGTALKSGVSHETMRRIFAAVLVVIAMDMAKAKIFGFEMTISNMISQVIRVFHI